MKSPVLITLALGLAATLASAQSYYKHPQLFSKQPDGSTNDLLRVWSGNTLMDLRKNEALQMRIESLKGIDYLFIETGGFQTKNGNTWKSPWFVMKRQ